MLAARLTDDLCSQLAPCASFRPAPTVADRAPWEGVSAAVRAAVLAEAAAYLDHAWPPLPAARYLDFVRDGNRTRYETLYFGRRRALGVLALAECLEDRGRFLDDIVNGSWALCEETSWVVPAHSITAGGRAPLPDPAEPFVDLFAAETASLLAWTRYLLRPRLDAVAPAIAARMRREVGARVLAPYLAQDWFWWLGFQPGSAVNNWNPWINSNILAACLLTCDDAAQRQAILQKAARSLDRFLAAYPADGGCDEGPMYWGQAGAALFDALEWIYRVTDGRVSLYAEPLIQEIGRYIYRMHISGDWFVNFADGTARLQIPGDLTYRYGQRIGDPALASLGLALRQPASAFVERNWFSFTRQLPALFDLDAVPSAGATPRLVRSVWVGGFQVMGARGAAGRDRGLYVAAKGGHNGESHNHNDVGQFIVYLDGQPAIIDPGVESYTAKTFSAQRYDIWTMQSAYHNLPTVRGIGQAPGAACRATDVRYTASDAEAALTLELGAAYPAEAGIRSWRRTIALRRGASSQVRIIEAFHLVEATADVTLSLLTPWAVTVAADGLLLQGATQAVRVTCGDGFSVGVERLLLDDERMTPVWGDHLSRIVLRPRTAVRDGVWTLTVTDASAGA